MADHADADGNVCNPGVPLIAWETDYCERQVQRIQKSLVDDGLLVIVATPLRQPIVYRIDLSAGIAKPAFVPRKNRVKGDKMSQCKGDILSENDGDKMSQGDIASAKTPPFKDKDKRLDALPKAGNASGAAISEPQPPVVTDPPPAVRPPNLWYDAIKAVWGFTESYNGELAKMLQGRSTRKGFAEYNLARDCLTPDDLRAWARWYRTNELNSDSNLHMLEDRMKIQSSITAWLERRQRKVADDQRRAIAEQQWRAAHPELYGEQAVHQ